MARPISVREKKLTDIIAKAKADLANLQKRRRTDLGQLAIDTGLGNIDLTTLRSRFKALAKELSKQPVEAEEEVTA